MPQALQVQAGQARSRRWARPRRRCSTYSGPKSHRRGADRLQAAGRRHGRPAHRRVRQDADVLALHHDAVRKNTMVERSWPPSRRSWRAWSGARPRRRRRPTAGDFQKVTLDDNTQNPMELDVAPDGRVFYIERDGRLMIWKPDTRQTVTAGTVPVTRSQENGLLGLQLAPDFAFSKWVYLFYSLLPDNTNTQVDRALQGQRRHARPELRAADPDLHAPARRSAATPRARCTSARTAACSSPPATTRTRSTRAATTRSTSAPAARPGTRSARRPTRTTSTARSCGSSRWRSRSARPASARPTRSRPATSSTRPRTRPTRPGRRSSAWASATRSASPSTRRRAGC